MGMNMCIYRTSETYHLSMDFKPDSNEEWKLLILGRLCGTCRWICNRSTLLTSGVPQNVDVVPFGSIPSLQSPKSVSTTW